MTTGDATRIRIMELLEQKEMTKYQLLCSTELSPTTIKNILNGKTRSSLTSTITLLCAGLNITPQEFFNSPLFNDLSMAADDALERDQA